MKFLKVLLVLAALFVAVWGAFWLFGVVTGLLFALVKWAIILGVLALAGVGAYKLLAGPDEATTPAALSPAEAEMMKAERLLAELRHKELTK